MIGLGSDKNKNVAHLLIYWLGDKVSCAGKNKTSAFPQIGSFPDRCELSKIAFHFYFMESIIWIFPRRGGKTEVVLGAVDRKAEISLDRSLPPSRALASAPSWRSSRHGARLSCYHGELASSLPPPPKLRCCHKHLHHRSRCRTQRFQYYQRLCLDHRWLLFSEDLDRGWRE